MDSQQYLNLYQNVPNEVTPEKIKEFENFDWSMETDDTKESFNNLPIFQMLNNKYSDVEKQESSVEIADNRQHKGDIYKHLQCQQFAYEGNRWLKDFKTNQTLEAETHQPIIKQMRPQMNMGSVAKMIVERDNSKAAATSKVCASWDQLKIGGHVADFPSPSQSFEQSKKPIPSPRYRGLEHHHIFCVLCNTADHNTANCIESPSFKFARIRDLQLCLKCLNSGHHIINCPFRDLACAVCGLCHLDYIFHEPTNWCSKQLDMAITTKLIDNLPSPCDVPASSNILKPFKIRGHLTEQFPYFLSPISGGGNITNHKSINQIYPSTIFENNETDVADVVNEEVD